MAKKKLKPSKSKNLFSFIHQYRLKIVLFSFFVIVPIVFVISLYTATYQTYKKVHFDVEVGADTVFINQFMKMDEIEEFDFSFTWAELKNPKLNLETDELEGGYYKFQMHYTPKSNYQITNLRVTPVLQTMWVDMRSRGNIVSLSTTAKAFVINFNYDLPITPLWFVKVTDPVLYLRFEYTYQTAGTPVNKTIYVRILLDDITPIKVIPNS